MTLYNITNDYNLMTYLEYPIILVQVYVLAYYVAKYRDQLNMPFVPMLVISYFSVMVFFVAGWLPKDILGLLVPFCTPLSGFAKLSYIYGIISAGNANAVSLTTWVISISTNLARVFTIYMDSGDTKLMANFYISTMLSAAVLCTAVYYKFCPTPQAPLSPPSPPPPPPPPPPTPAPPRHTIIRRNIRHD